MIKKHFYHLSREELLGRGLWLLGEVFASCVNFRVIDTAWILLQYNAIDSINFFFLFYFFRCCRFSKQKKKKKKKETRKHIVVDLLTPKCSKNSSSPDDHYRRVKPRVRDIRSCKTLSTLQAFGKLSKNSKLCCIKIFAVELIARFRFDSR